MDKYLKYKQKYLILKGGSAAFSFPVYDVPRPIFTDSKAKKYDKELLIMRLEEYDICLTDKSLDQVYEKYNIIEDAIHYVVDNIPPLYDEPHLKLGVDAKTDSYSKEKLKEYLERFAITLSEEKLEQVFRSATNQEDALKNFLYNPLLNQEVQVELLIPLSETINVGHGIAFPSGKEYNFHEYMKQVYAGRPHIKILTIIPKSTQIYIAVGNGLCLFNSIFYALGHQIPEQLLEDIPSRNPEFIATVRSALVAGAKKYASLKADTRLNIDTIGGEYNPANFEILDFSYQDQVEYALDCIMPQTDIDASITVLLTDLYNINIIVIAYLMPSQYIIFSPVAGQNKKTKDIILLKFDNHFDLLKIKKSRRLNFLQNLLTLHTLAESKILLEHIIEFRQRNNTD